jgi:hypothetical protein
MLKNLAAAEREGEREVERVVERVEMEVGRGMEEREVERKEEGVGGGCMICLYCLSFEKKMNFHPGYTSPRTSHVSESRVKCEV